MNQILKVILIALGVFVVAGGLFFAGTVFASRWSQRADLGDGPIGPRANLPGPGMIEGGRSAGNQPGREAGSNDRMDGGQDGSRDNGRGAGSQPGKLPGGNREQANLTPVTVDEAKTAAQAYLTALQIDGLEIGDVIVLDADAYVVIKETATGNGAFELIVDPRSKTAHPARGAATMWNLKYGGVLHANMLDQHAKNDPNATPEADTDTVPAATPADVSTDTPVSAEQAVAAAQAFLDQAVPGATASAAPLKFYGYYSLSFSKDGEVVGILSVNGYNGDVLPNGPHGMNNPESR